jgi:hypothetical protein
LPSPGDATHLVIFGKTGSPQGNEESCLYPVHEMGVYGAWAAKSLKGQCLPLATSPQNIQYRFKYRTGVDGLSATSRFSFIGLIEITLLNGYQWFYFVPKRIRYFP